MILQRIVSWRQSVPRIDVLWTIVLALVGLILWAAGSNGSKVTDLGTGILTGVTVATLVLTLERRHAGLRELQQAEREEARSTLAEQAEAVREAERRKLLIQQLLAGNGAPSGLDLSNSDLGAVSLRGKCLSHCTMQRITMHEADLNAAVFTSCDFSGSRFGRVSMRDVRFVDCDLSGVELQFCDLTDAQLERCNTLGLRVAGSIYAGLRTDRADGFPAAVAVVR